jgi:predicted nuclease of predicted toxin-antitoxin system
MKLLFDHNLSPQLVIRLQDCFPNASHVATLGLATASDLVVWTYAQNEGFTIVTKDADFSDVAILRGYPPKIIWIRLGNCTTRQIEETLRRHQFEIAEFADDSSSAVLEIFS